MLFRHPAVKVVPRFLKAAERLRQTPATTFSLSFTHEEKKAFAELGKEMMANPGKSFPLPAICQQGLNRVMAPVDAALHENLLKVRAQEHRVRPMLFHIPRSY